MPTGHCPECNNLVAESARFCPKCGNRDFRVSTENFVEICKSCSGTGRIYSYKNSKPVEQNCGGCSGNGFYYRHFEVDCRNGEDFAHYSNLARKYQKDESEISQAITNQTLNTTFVNRGGRLRSDEMVSAGLSYQADAILKASNERERGIRDAKAQFKRNAKFSITAWTCVGIGGCVVRVASGGGEPNITAPFKAFFIEGLIAAVFVFVTVGLLAFAKIKIADSKYKWNKVKFGSKYITKND